jgi:hypothetical protein
MQLLYLNCHYKQQINIEKNPSIQMVPIFNIIYYSNTHNLRRDRHKAEESLRVPEAHHESDVMEHTGFSKMVSAPIHVEKPYIS